MKKNISRNPLWPDWYNGKKIDEVQFGDRKSTRLNSSHYQQPRMPSSA